MPCYTLWPSVLCFTATGMLYDRVLFLAVNKGERDQGALNNLAEFTVTFLKWDFNKGLSACMVNSPFHQI